ncbi:hypothetical protein ACFY30_33085 [Streptomyces sp. NPDC000345]|uniref:hypothetical protein n=1 Tax=Streptomyces sp. NPDC000345 TaxID=3364537 RepID=UPI0036C014FA
MEPAAAPTAPPLSRGTGPAPTEPTPGGSGTVPRPSGAETRIAQTGCCGAPEPAGDRHPLPAPVDAVADTVADVTTALGR